MVTKKNDAPYKFISFLIAILVNGLGLWELILPAKFSGLRVGITAGAVIPISVLLLVFNRPRLTKTQFFYLLIICLQVGLLFLLINRQNEQNGFQKAALFLILAVIPSIIIILNFNKSYSSINILLIYICLFSFVPIIRMFLMGVTFEDWWSGYGAYLLRINGYDVIGLARSIGIGMLIVAFKFFQNPRKKLIFIFVVVAMGIAQFLLRERGPIYITLFTMGLFTTLRIKPRYKLIVIFISVLALIPLISYYGKLDPRFNLNTLQSDPRIALFNRSINLFFDNPIIGVGTASFSIPDLAIFDQRVYSHNIFLEIMVENGVLGLLIFLSTLAVLIVSLLKSKEKLQDPLFKELLILFAYSFLQAQLSGDLTNNYFVWFFSSCLMGYLGSLHYLSISRNNTQFIQGSNEKKAIISHEFIQQID
jgi:O-antigen ligase